jgi:transcriptional regulator with GAF, ATPase, and Fis domain
MQGEVDTQHTLERAVAIATEIIPSCDFAGVSVVHRNRPIDTPAMTDEVVERVDRLQYEVQQGPCLDAIWDHETVHSPDLSREERWPAWAPKVAKMDISSMLCLQLYTSEDTLGALNLLSSSAEA